MKYPLRALLVLNLRFFSLHLLYRLHLIELHILQSLVLILHLSKDLEFVFQLVLHCGHLIIDASASELDFELFDILLHDLCFLLLAI